MSTSVTGQVKWFNMKAGFGFITVCDHSDFGDLAGKDIFVHFSAINVEQSQYKYLIQGEYVDFFVMKSENEKHELQACNVRGVYNGPIMCETKKEVKSTPVNLTIAPTLTPQASPTPVEENNDGFITKTRKRTPKTPAPKKRQPKSVDESAFIPVMASV
jgi:cold shock CspA family protein